MSFIIDDSDNELNTNDLLKMILIELKLLNARVEDEFITGISEEDIEDE